jgi:hypothetical protein
MCFWSVQPSLIENRVICKLTLSLGLLSPPMIYPLFQWYLQSKDILINLSRKCWYSAFNAQGLRQIIVVVQLGAVKIYVAAVEVLRKNERQDETQFTTKIDGFLSFIPCWMLVYFFASFFWMSPCVWPISGFWWCVFLTSLITLILQMFKYMDLSPFSSYSWSLKCWLPTYVWLCTKLNSSSQPFWPLKRYWHQIQQLWYWSYFKVLTFSFRNTRQSIWFNLACLYTFTICNLGVK